MYKSKTFVQSLFILKQRIAYKKNIFSFTNTKQAYLIDKADWREEGEYETDTQWMMGIRGEMLENVSIKRRRRPDM